MKEYIQTEFERREATKKELKGREEPKRLSNMVCGIEKQNRKQRKEILFGAAHVPEEHEDLRAKLQPSHRGHRS